MCVCGPAGLSHPVSPLPLYICGEQQRVCVQTCLCVRLYNAEQPFLPPQLEKKKKSHTARRPLWNTRCSFGKSRRLGCLHFSDWEGKKTRCPLELLSSVHTEITHIAMGDRPVCVWGGGVEVSREHWAKSLNTLWWLAAGRHDIMQQCWKLATLVKFVCLNSTHSPFPQTTCTHTHSLFLSVFLFPSYYPVLLLSCSWMALLSSPIVDTLFANSSSTSLSVKKTMRHEWEYVMWGFGELQGSSLTNTHHHKHTCTHTYMHLVPGGAADVFIVSLCLLSIYRQ